MIDIPSGLVTGAIQGDSAAFEEIYRLSGSFVYSVALRILANSGDAEEVTQEVFVKVHRSLKDFGFRSSFNTWLYRITTNMAINAYNKRARERGRRADYDEALNVASSEPCAEQGIAGSETEEALGSLLNMMTAEHRAVIVLRELEGLNYKEMANALNININTVRTRLKRAREALMAHAKKGVIHHEV
jgi:RNA polymerase sigma-70 factor (ECF subfamily)